MARILDEIRTAPERLATRSNELGRRARQRAHTLRLDGEGRLFHMRVDTLERVEDLLAKAPEWPGLSKVADAAERMVSERLTAYTHPPVADYDELSAKAVNESIRELAYVDLLRVRRWEETHKNRVTVLRAVERELERREQVPLAESTA